MVGSVRMGDELNDSHNHDGAGVSLLALASHDLRTPLAIIQGYGGLLEDGLPADADPLMRESAATIMAYAKSFQYLIGNLLALEQSERGELRLSPARRDLNELAGAALAEIDGLLAIKGLTVERRLPPSAAWAEVDEKHIIRALYAVLAQAEKAARPGGALRIEVADEGESARVSLSDPARPTPQEGLDKLFRLERHADVGLIAARAIIEAHGGRLTAHGAPGEGVTFTLYLPRVDESAI